MMYKRLRSNPITKHSNLLRRVLFCLATTSFFIPLIAYPINPLHGPHTKYCSNLALAEMETILHSVQSSITDNYAVSNITLTASSGRPFKKNQNIVCQTSTVNNLTVFRCTGTFGEPCGVASNKKFVCKFLGSDQSEGFHHPSSANTSSAVIPTNIDCQICMTNIGTETVGKLGKIHNLYQKSGQVILVPDPSGTTCW